MSKYRADAVVLDASSGLNVFQQIHDCDPSVPVILMAAQGTANAAIEAIARGRVRLCI